MVSESHAVLSAKHSQQPQTKSGVWREQKKIPVKCSLLKKSSIAGHHAGLLVGWSPAWKVGVLVDQRRVWFENSTIPDLTNQKPTWTNMEFMLGHAEPYSRVRSPNLWKGIVQRLKDLDWLPLIPVYCTVSECKSGYITENPDSAVSQTALGARTCFDSNVCPQADNSVT